jgi:hypothetical protein
MNAAKSNVTSSKPKISPNLSFLLGSEVDASGGMGSLNFLLAFIMCLTKTCSICAPFKITSILNRLTTVL